MKTLVLYSSYTDQMSYFDDWVDAFKEHPNYHSECVNVFNTLSEYANICKKIEKAELIVIHHSMNGDTLKYIHPFINALKNRKGKLVSFVGNEVNLPTIGMAPKIKNLQEIEPEIIATQLLQEAGEWLYQNCTKSKVISLPHALNPKAFFSNKNLKQRKIDIGTRSARYGVYIGDNDRNNIIRFFHDNSQKFGLSVDLGLNDGFKKRFNRQDWAVFLSSCKATLSTEAGSFYLEKDDKLVQQIQEYLKKSSRKFVLPNETVLRKIYRNVVPLSVRRSIVNLLKDKLTEVDCLDEESDFNEIYEMFFSKTQRCPAYSKAISSRHFDAIGTKTLHIMYPGRYNDILRPGEHYFELKQDHSNVDELKDCLKDDLYITNVTEKTYEHIIFNHTHKNRLDTLFGHF